MASHFLPCVPRFCVQMRKLRWRNLACQRRRDVITRAMNCTNEPKARIAVHPLKIFRFAITPEISDKIRPVLPR
jgi:hypothetical protein